MEKQMARMLRMKTIIQKRKVIKKDKFTANNDYKKTNALGATFWMSLSDFCKYFYIMTVNYTNKEYV